MKSLSNRPKAQYLLRQPTGPAQKNDVVFNEESSERRGETRLRRIYSAPTWSFSRSSVRQTDVLEAVVGSTASFLIQSRSPQAELVDHSCVRLAQQRNPGEKHKGDEVHVGGGRITLSVDHVNNECFRACFWFEFHDIARTGRSPIACRPFSLRAKARQDTCASLYRDHPCRPESTRAPAVLGSQAQ